MKNEMYINEVRFETKTLKRANTDIERLINNLKTLNKCYEKPSAIKREIYDGWMQWKETVPELTHFGIDSFNCFNFNLRGVLCDLETNEIFALIHITKTHKRLFFLIP